MSLFDKTTDALRASTNLRKLRQELISSNVANAETPGFHAQKMDFEEALARSVDLDGMRAMQASHPEHMALGGTDPLRVRPEVYDNPEAEVSQDGNTVNLEKEMAALAENTVLYKAAIQLMNKKLAALRYAATEGR